MKALELLLGSGILFRALDIIRGAWAPTVTNGPQCNLGYKANRKTLNISQIFDLTEAC